MGSSFLQAAFAGLAVIVTIGGVAAFRWAAPSGEPRERTLRWVAGAALVSGLWLTLTGSLAAAGVLRVPFQIFRDGPPNTFVAELPYVWLPTVLVQAALVGHLLVWRKLRTIAAPSPNPLDAAPQSR